MQSSGMKEDKEQRFAPWVSAVRQPNEREKRRMLTEAIKVAVRFIMKNHVYNFDNVIYKWVHHRFESYRNDRTGCDAVVGW